MPSWTAPALATLYKKEPFNDPEWIFEKKLDGVRCLAYSDGKNIKLLTRNKNEVNEEYPEIAQALQNLSNQSFIVDGEIVVGQGKKGSFSKMQNRIGVKKPSEELQKKYPLNYYLFDILFFGDEDLTDQPLIERKNILKSLSFSGKVRYTPHRNKEGKSFLDKMRKSHFEGAIAKERSSKYLSTRTKKWLKLKLQNRQELIVGGFTDPQGERKGFGALLVGFYDRGKLVYAGKVGTGYSAQELEDLHQKLSKIERKTSPFQKNSPDDDSCIHWVTPKLVAEIEFTEWTTENKLRHPSYIGIREDKEPEKVIKEV